MRTCPACNSHYQDDVKFCNKDGTEVVLDAMAQEHSEEADALLGEIIGDRYRLLRKIGEGGMGEVYQAEHIHIEKHVALKLLRPEILSNKEAVARFRQEARSASSIGHPNIIGIDDFGTTPDGRVYLTMEFLDGAPLSDMIIEPLAFDRALSILIQTGHGLAAAHAKGIVHRDMKPENVFVTRGDDGGDVAKLLDFGIAKVSGNDENQNLTRTGTIFGTPFYMAPEQALGQKIDHRADVYAMGIIMYEVFTGTVPFKADSFMGILTQHITGQVRPPAEAAAEMGREIPEELAEITLHALAKDPDDRYQTMNELTEALTEVYRKYVGAGSTAPLASQPINASQMIASQSPRYTAAQGAASTPSPFASTSFSSSAQAVAKPKSKMMALVLVLLFALVGAGGALGWYYFSHEDEHDDHDHTANLVTPPAVVKPDAALVAVVDKPDVIPEKPAPVHVLISSRPQGATVWVDGKALDDVTPMQLAVTIGEPVSLTLRKKGYKDRELIVDGSAKKITEKLARKHRHKPKDKGRDIKGWDSVTDRTDKKDHKKDNKTPDDDELE